MSLPRYSDYKDSGVAWLGEVPEHWEVKRFGYFFSERREKVSDKDFEPLSVTKNGILPQLETAAKTDDGDNRKKVCKGDFVINSRSDRKGSAGMALQDGSVSLINTVIQPQSEIRIEYVHHLLRSIPFQEEFYRYGKGIVADLWSTNFSEMRNINLAVPSIEEQQAIAAFLDRETGKIDALVVEQGKLIALLKEKRQAVISHAVTKGLNPNAKMKDSGTCLSGRQVEWLGEVPEHWRVVPIKAVATLTGRIGFRGYTTADIVDEGDGAITLSPSNMGDGDILLTKCAYISWKKYHESPEIKVSRGDVIMVKTGSTLGKVAIVRQEIPPSTINPQLVIFKRIDCNPTYLFFSLYSSRMQAEIEVSNTGGTIPTMTQESIGNFVLPLPPREEQSAIAAFLDTETAKFDNLTTEANRAIALLKERRSALISAAVTGKIDVRNVGELSG